MDQPEVDDLESSFERLLVESDGDIVEATKIILSTMMR